jgi:hypothetical protein
MMAPETTPLKDSYDLFVKSHLSGDWLVGGYSEGERQKARSKKQKAGDARTPA